jgi:general secretion pathway protein F
VLFPAAAVVLVGLKFYAGTERGALRWDELKLKLLGDVVTKLETARFCRTLGTLLKSGVPFLQALGNARDVIGNRIIAGSVESITRNVREGRGIAGPLMEAGVFPQLALSMIKVGEETGQLDIMLLKVAATYEKALRDAVKRFMSLLEPAIILCMGIIIAFIVVSMLMAVFSILELPF